MATVAGVASRDGARDEGLSADCLCLTLRSLHLAGQGQQPGEVPGAAAQMDSGTYIHAWALRRSIAPCWTQTAQGSILLLPLRSWVTLGKLFNL